MRIFQPVVSGSLTVTNGITGSLFGTSSWAVSASWAPSAGLTGGTTNYVPLWTSTTALSSSAIYQSTNKVGIGTTVPLYTLDVSGSINLPSTERIYWKNGSGSIFFNTGDNFVIATWSGSTNNNRMVVTSAGNVGIGKTNPATTLDITGSATVTGSLRVTQGITGSLLGTASWATNVTNNGVTSVSASGTVSGITLGGGPITSTGTVTLSGTLAVTPSNFSSQTANTFLAAPNGSSGTPTFRTIVAADIPTLNQNTTGNASTATTSGLLTAEDNRTISPSELAANRLKFGFTSWTNDNNSPYADFLHLRSYGDGSGGNDNLVMFRKDAIGMRIWQQTYGSATAYSSYKDVAWTDGTNASGNWTINVTGSLFGTSSWATNATTATNADTVDSLHAASFVRSDADDVFTGNLTTGADNHITFGPNSSWGSSLRIGGNGRTATGTEMASIVTTDGNIHLDAANSNNGIYLNYYAGTAGTGFGNGASAIVAWMGSDGDLWKGSSDNSGDRYWHAGNDGASSGLDADLLDGNHASAFQLALTNPVTGTGTSGRVALWNGTTSITSDADLVFDGTNLGVGTASPTVASGYSTVTLDGTTGTFTEYRQNGSALFRIGVDSSRPFFYGMTNASMEFYTNTASRMVITGDGNVGIGTTTPTVRLQVDRNGTGVIAGFSNQNDADLTINLTSGVSLITPNTGILAFGTNATERMRITSNGRVGVGITNPDYKFQVYDTSDGIVGHFGGGVSNYTLISFKSNEANVYSTSLGSYNSGMLFRTGATDRMYINSSGNVGIGTTSPIHPLSVVGRIGSHIFGDSHIEFLSNGNTSLKANNDVIIGYSQNTVVTQAGNVGIGTTSPASGNKLEVNGRAFTNQLQYTRAIDITSGNLNDYTTAGFYNGNGMTNAPNSGWFWVTVERYTADAGWCHQTATTFGSGNTANEVYTRVLSGGNWGSWKELTSNTGTVTGTGADNRVAVWSGTTTQDSDANLTWNGTTFNVGGTLTATVKSFIIDHPTKPNKKLQYGVLEGPEHSVYVRGKLTNNNTITLPDHWTGLVHEDTITVSLTPIGKRQDLWVETVTHTTITVGSDNEINCFYTVFAERKDIEKLVTEFDK